MIGNQIPSIKKILIKVYKSEYLNKMMKMFFAAESDKKNKKV